MLQCHLNKPFSYNCSPSLIAMASYISAVTVEGLRAGEALTIVVGTSVVTAVVE